MLRILHLLTGLAALLLSFTPSLRSEALPYLLQTDALLLLLFGLLNLLLGSFVIYRESEKHPALQVVVSVLLILSDVRLVVVVIALLEFMAGTPAVDTRIPHVPLVFLTFAGRRRSHTQPLP